MRKSVDFRVLEAGFCPPCAEALGCAFIYLSRRGEIPTEVRCDIPGIIGRAARSPILPCTGLGLSCLLRYLRSGELLPPHFTLTSGKPKLAQGGIFSATLSVTSSCPNAPPLSQGILPYGVRTFLSILRPSERPHSEIDSDKLTHPFFGRKR